MILNIIHVVTVNFMLQYGQLGGFKGGGHSPKVEW